MTFTELTVSLAVGYLTAGLIMALPLVLWGVNRIDPAARQGSWGFRLLILPGTVLLWPVLLSKVVRSFSGGEK